MSAWSIAKTRAEGVRPRATIPASLENEVPRTTGIAAASSRVLASSAEGRRISTAEPFSARHSRLRMRISVFGLVFEAAGPSAVTSWHRG